MTKHHVEGRDRRQSFLLPECMDDNVIGEKPVQVVEAFIDALDLLELGFVRSVPAETGRSENAQRVTSRSSGRRGHS